MLVLLGSFDTLLLDFTLGVPYSCRIDKFDPKTLQIQLTLN